VPGRPAPVDEQAHQPDDAGAHWIETWDLDVATPDGLGIAVRLALVPSQRVAWWWTHVLLPGRSGPVVVRDHDVVPPRQGLEIRADGLWGELWCETPFEHWTYGLEAFGVALDDATDAFRGEIGERMPVGLDLEWEVDGADAAPHELATGAGARGYEQLGIAHGELLLGRERLAVDGVARRAHSWGPDRLDRAAGAMWFGSDAITASVAFDAAGDGAGGFVRAGAHADAIERAHRETQRGAYGLPVAARAVVDGRFEIDVDVVGAIAVPLAGAGGDVVLARALCAYEIAATGDPSDRAVDALASEPRAVGWSSWLDAPEPLA